MRSANLAARAMKGPVPEFDGAMRDLLRLCQAGEIDLREIALAEVIRAAAEGVDTTDLEAMTVLLQQAAWLVEQKSRQLVGLRPAEEPRREEETAGPDVTSQLPDYLVFREATSALAALEAWQSRIFTRPPVGSDPSELPLGGVRPEDLVLAFQRVLERARTEVREVPPEGVTVAERIAFILEVLSAHPEGVEFEALFSEDDPKVVLIVTFLALLELIRRRQVRAEQRRPFGPIRLFQLKPEASP